MRQTAAGRTLVVTLLLPALFGARAGPRRSSQAPTTIKYGAPTATPDITTVGVYFAIENGYFKREGLDVQVTRYPGSTTAMRALLSGDADVVETGGDTALLAMESGAKIDILLSPVARSTDVVVAKAPIASLADLKGKSFAVSAPGSPGMCSAGSSSRRTASTQARCRSWVSARPPTGSRRCSAARSTRRRRRSSSWSRCWTRSRRAR